MKRIYISRDECIRRVVHYSNDAVVRMVELFKDINTDPVKNAWTLDMIQRVYGDLMDDWADLYLKLTRVANDNDYDFYLSEDGTIGFELKPKEIKNEIRKDLGEKYKEDDDKMFG